MTKREEKTFEEMEESYAKQNAAFLRKEEKSRAFNCFMINTMREKENVELDGEYF